MAVYINAWNGECRWLTSLAPNRIGKARGHLLRLRFFAEIWISSHGEY